MSELFNNRENECVNLPDGREVWLSRSVAVVGIIRASSNDGPLILLCKRGPNCPDEVGKWCLPCGYIDWDEDGLDGFRREVLEETGIFIDLDEDYWRSKNKDPRQPWKVNTDPVNSNRQNISLYFELKWNRSSPAPVPDLDMVNREETENVQWFPLNEALELELAFNHRMVLETFFDKGN